jgi:hypothetical protein
VLIILDTVHVDAMEQLAPEFEFINTVESIRSPGSTSSEWIAKTFTDEYREEIEGTIPVSANPHVQRTLYERQFPGHDKDACAAATAWETVTSDAFAHIEQL